MSQLLFETDSNPIPEGMKSGFFTAKDRKKLRYAILKPQTTLRQGTVLLLHGRNEYIEKYFETASDLSLRGFCVATFDWRGQGRSDRLLRNPLRGYVKNFSDYTDDLDQFLKEIVLPDCPPPYFILAHSAGGLIAYASMARLTNRINRMVLLAPLLGIDNPQMSDDAIRRMMRIMCRVGLGRTFAIPTRKLIKRPFLNNALTSDPERFMRNQEMVQKFPELGLAGPTYRWVSSALETAYRINQPDYQSEPSVPVLIIAAGADRVVSTQAIERFASRTRNVSLAVINGAQHELLQESDFYREQALAAFDAFIPGTPSVESMPPMIEPRFLV